MKNLNLLAVSTASAVILFTTSAFAQGDVEKGKKVAKKCVACHTLNEGGRNKLGPPLFGVLDRKAASIKAYKYSKAMKNSGIVWDEHTFNDFITKPKKALRGTKMSFRGIKKASKRLDLIAYFKTLKSGEAGAVAAVVGNVEDGKKVAKKHCTVCHSFNKGGKVVFGPNLFDIAGKPAGVIKGFKYSKALKNSGLIWTEKNVIAFMSNPQQFVKGTTARFPGLKNNKDKADVVAYIKSLK